MSTELLETCTGFE